MSRYKEIKEQLKNNPKKWLITGVAGFIGSNLLETLLKLGQTVVGLDNFSTGYQHNLDEVKALVSEEEWKKFAFIEGDIRNYSTCQTVISGIDYVLHQAALGSVPRSIEAPLTSNDVNISGFLNMLHASKEEGVKSFTYAASSSTYGDHPALPKLEGNIGSPLSPYAVTKYVNELYANVYSRVYGFNSIGLRYFNIFGKRQDPHGSYAAVIPKWISAMLKGEELFINGDGETSRDFTFVENAIQMNLLASVASSDVKNQVYNVALGDRTSLNNLFITIRNIIVKNGYNYQKTIKYRDFREGDVRHSQADIGKAVSMLGYKPTHNTKNGLLKTVDWYISKSPTKLDDSKH